MRKNVSSHSKLPGNWMNFLQDSMNKKELFGFQTSKIEEFSGPQDKAVYVTSGPAVISIGSSSPLNKYNQEEADMRLLVHILHALDQGEQNFLVFTVDTDVIVILVGTFHDMLATQALLDI